MIVGCNPATPAPTTGKLELQVLQNPAGTSPVVTLSGNGKVVSLEASQELTPGGYVLRAPELKPTDTHNYQASIAVDGGTATPDQASLKIIAGQTTKAIVTYLPTTGFIPVSVTAPTGQTAPEASYVLKGSSDPAQKVSSGKLKLLPGTYVFSPGTLAGFQVSPASVERTVAAGQTTDSVSFSYASSFAQLNLTLSAPSGITPQVQISGPNGYSNTFSTSQSLQLAPGAYTLSPINPAPLEGVSYSGTANPATVSLAGGDTKTATVSYAATNSAVKVNLSGLLTGDVASVTLTRTDAAFTPRTQSPTAQSPNQVLFSGLPFGQYQVSVAATRGASFLGANNQSGATTATSPLLTMNFTLAVVGQAQAVVGGNGDMLGSNALYGLSNTDLQTPPTALSNPFIPLATSQYTAVPTPDISEACYDSYSRSPTRMFFDPKGNLYIYYAGKSVPAMAGCPIPYSNRNPPTQRNLYLDAFMLRVSPENLKARLFYTIATGTELGLAPPATIRTPQGTTRTFEYVVPAAGNKIIYKSAFPTVTFNYLEDFTPATGEAGSEVAGLAFDANNNMWFSNKESAVLGCISATQLEGTGSEIRYANRVFTNPFADSDYDSGTRLAGVDPTLNNAFRNPSALAIDRDGNLWFTSDNWLYGGNNFSRLSRINNSQISCPATVPTADPTPQTVTPDVRLDISITPSARAVFNPVAMALAPDGNSLWIADSGGNDDIVLPYDNRWSCPRNYQNLVVGGVTSSTQVACSVGADVDEESIVQVPIRNADGTPHANAAINTTPLRTAIISDRISVGSGALQQPMALAFDYSGRLWVATNNNMNVTQNLVDLALEAVPQYFRPKSTFAAALKDRKGKLYAFNLPTSANPSPAQPRAVTPIATLSANTDVGLSGLAMYLPRP